MRSNHAIALLCAICMLTSCTNSENRIFPTDNSVALEMESLMQGSDLPAIVATAVNTQGESVAFSYGKAIWTVDDSVGPDHIFRIFSMTKLVTSIAALQCVEQGLVELDEDLSAHLPEMAVIPLLKDGKLVEPEKPITLRHLLTHTAGFGYTGYTTDAPGFDQSIWEYEDGPRHFESGTAFLYGTNTDWVGKLVEKLTGRNLESYFMKHITGPLNMHRTFFNVPDSLHHLVVSHGSRGTDGLQALNESESRIPNRAEIYSGGGGLFSTPSDFTKLLKCLLNEGVYDGGQLLSREMVYEMRQPHTGDISLDPANNPYHPGYCCNFNDLIKSTSSWGLAFMIDHDMTSYGRKAGTVTWGGLMNTYFYIDYESGIAASIYSQHLPFNHDETVTLFDKFSSLLYEKINE